MATIAPVAQMVGDFSAKSLPETTPSLQHIAYAQVMAVLTQNHPGTHQYASPQMAYPQVCTPADQTVALYHAFATSQGASLEPSQWKVPQFKQTSYVPLPSLTAGLPDPESVEQQKAHHLESIAAREEQTLASLEKQRQCYLDALHEEAERQRNHMMLLIEEQVQQMEITLGHEFNGQVTLAKQQHNELRSLLEHQAIQLVAEFQKKHLLEVALTEQAKLDQEKEASNRKYQLEMQRLQQLRPQPAHIKQTPSCAPLVEAASDVSTPPQNVRTHSQLAQAVSMTSGSYVSPPMTHVTHVGQSISYVPPDTVPVPAKIGSYVPPPVHLASMPQVSNEAYRGQLPTATGSYDPPTPATIYQTMGSCPPTPATFYRTVGSCTPEALHSAGNGSIVPPPIVTVASTGSYMHLPSVNADSHVGMMAHPSDSMTIGLQVSPLVTHSMYATSNLPTESVLVTAQIGSYVPPPVHPGPMPLVVNEACCGQLPTAIGSYISPPAATTYPTMGACVLEAMHRVGNGSYVAPTVEVASDVSYTQLPSVNAGAYMGTLVQQPMEPLVTFRQ